MSVALPAVLSALAVLLLYLSGLIPSGKWAVVAVAGLCPAAAVVSAGLLAGGLTYASAGILAFLLAPNKGNVLLFVLFFGLYPVVKSLIERLKKLPLEIFCKMVFFNGILTLFYFAFASLLMPALPELLKNSVPLLYLAANIIFGVYDLGFTKLMGFYRVRIDKVIRR
ncbi:MAG: hypothetical protein RSB55_00130 [Oscillospiraceae bacterium]